jgi:hypothetical protein
MAGSRKWFVYASDLGEDYAIQLDESNTEAVMGGADGDYTDTSGIQAAVPRNITPRAVYYGNAARTRTIKCTVLSSDRYSDVVSGAEAQTIPDPIAGTGTLTLIRAEGEKISIPFPFDTGIQDGDAT